ncbi:glycoside hydrolase family 5 protein [Cryobacterium sp. PAMC25264]|uniref:glycoside hydrolase family 5 protein n=1 Tax=Cryobacterium sp. PAMC25264 TaxID=2861288 RepID=UPI001C63AF8E|nr:glycoside hydrolase family 5 protein [Cryobacterium sp. PAMC25264]QYF74598.1 cellulase family glycosylhydrolase [Cryobacterium sp. PAMC25264]
MSEILHSRARTGLVALVLGAVLLTGTAAASVSPATASAAAASPAAAAARVTDAVSTAVTATAATPTTPGWLHTSGGTILTASGAPYVIKGVSWFGMETSNCAPHGLWTISLASGLAQIKAMGFTTLRLPFSNECLAAPATSSINYAVNPDLVDTTPQELLDIVVSKAAAAGLTVILDRHRPDSGAQSELWYTAQYSEARWIADWQALAARYRNDPTVIGVDLHNEPHGPACWGCGNPETDWQAAATRGGNAVLSVNPNLLILVEGIENQASGTSTWWGGGLSGVAAKPVTLTVPNRVVYSPHDYPASVYAQKWFSASTYPANLTSVWDANWGYISKNGIAPVLVGEFGSKLETTSDTQWMSALVGYLAANKTSFAYWSFNPNSGDTGGIVADDWVTPQATKLAALAPLVTSGATTPIPAPAPTPTASATPIPTPKPAVTPKPTVTPTATPKPTVTPKPTATPKPTVTPKPSATPTATPTTAPTAAAGATVAWQLQNAWSVGYVTELLVTGTTGVTGWTATWPDTKATSIVNAWGMTCTLTAKTSITCTGSDWAAVVPAGQTARVGVQVAASAAPVSPVLTVTTR